MNTRKTVIFIIDNKAQVYTEFNENANIGILRTYVRDTTRFETFEIIYNGIPIKNDNVKLKRIFAENGSNTSIVFHIKSETCTEGNSVEVPCPSCKKLKEELDKLKRDKEKIFSQLKDEENEKDEIYKKYEILLQENEKFKIELENLNILLEETKRELALSKKEGNVIEQTNIKNEITFQNETNSHTKTEIDPIKTVSVIDFESGGSQAEKNEKVENDKSRKKENKTLSKTSMSQSACNITCSNFKMELLSPSASPKNLNLQLITQKGFNYKIKIIHKNLQKNSVWTNVLWFMSSNDQINFSISNKEKGVNVLLFWLDFIYTKHLHLKKRKSFTVARYNDSLTSTKFQLSHFSNSALKILNNNNHIKVIEQDNSIFTGDNSIISIYKLFFQFSNKNFSSENDNDFINEMKADIQQETQSKNIGLGDYLKDEILRFDFSNENIEKILHILSSYNITSINNSEISKKCKTTGIISFLVKDALVFAGIETDQKTKSSEIKERNNLHEEKKQLAQLNAQYELLTNKINGIITNHYVNK